MNSKLVKLLNSKREFMIYVVIMLWIMLGVLSFRFNANILELSAYFLSLTGFVSSYIYGETKRQSATTSIFMKGENSKREVMLYVVITLWTALGIFTIIKSLNLIEMSAYFAALTPFVGAYIIGETVKVDEPVEPAA